MKVKELIEKLQSLNDPNADVIVWHYGNVIAVDPSEGSDGPCIRTDSEEIEE